jgi:hypothetical protein
MLKTRRRRAGEGDELGGYLTVSEDQFERLEKSEGVGMPGLISVTRAEQA